MAETTMVIPAELLARLQTTDPGVDIGTLIIRAISEYCDRHTRSAGSGPGRNVYPQGIEK